MRQIRELTAQDYCAMIEVWKSAGLPFRPKGRDSEESIRKQLESGSVEILGADDNGRLVGIVLLTHDGRKGWINRLAVIPEMRHRGIAAELIREAERLLMERGYEVFGVLIESDKTESRKLFEKLGYVRETEIEYFTKRLRKEA